MAYITRANFKRISWSLNDKQYKGELVVVCEELPQLRFDYLNKCEKQALLAFKEFVLNPEIILKPEYRRLNNIDTKQFVFEGTSAYHCDAECDLLNKDFDGILLPKKIKEKGDAKVEEFRIWYKENMHLLDEGKDERAKFQLHLWAKFGLELRDIDHLHKGNSGSTDFENYSLEEVCNEMLKLTNSFKEWVLNDPDKNLQELRKYSFFDIAYNGKCTYLGNPDYKKEEHLNDIRNRNQSRFSEEEIRSCLEEAHNTFKLPMIELLKKYYMIKYNSNNKVDRNVLEALGFKPCSQCYPSPISGKVQWRDFGPELSSL